MYWNKPTANACKWAGTFTTVMVKVKPQQQSGVGFQVCSVAAPVKWTPLLRLSQQIPLGILWKTFGKRGWGWVVSVLCLCSTLWDTQHNHEGCHLPLFLLPPPCLIPQQQKGQLVYRENKALQGKLLRVLLMENVGSHIWACIVVWENMEQCVLLCRLQAAPAVQSLQAHSSNHRSRSKRYCTLVGLKSELSSLPYFPDIWTF